LLENNLLMFTLTPFAARVREAFAANPKTYVVGHIEIENETAFGRTVQIRNKECVLFGSASYLGLELEPSLKAGAIQAIENYGTQFSSSRSYVGLPLYSQLEAHWEQILERPVVITPTTTLGHLAFLPHYVHAEDLVVVDLLAHASLQMAVQVLRANGTEIARLQHNDMAGLEKKLQSPKNQNRRVWYIGDGIYSMHGDTVPAAELRKLLDTYDNLYVYLDDAHGTGWCGQHGRGWVAEYMGNHERLVIALSLNKTVAAGGGLLALPNREMKAWIKESGGPLVFSGPVQPAQLGAGLASAKFLLSDAYPARQAKLLRLIDVFLQTAQSLGLKLVNSDPTPIFFIEVGSMFAGLRLSEMLLEAGYYVNTGVFPAVAQNKTGLRISLNYHLEEADIKQMLRLAAELRPIALHEAAKKEEVEKARV
jgi:7-keto-8-aminopelargonate synthetase-like enzyme